MNRFLLTCIVIFVVLVIVFIVANLRPPQKRIEHQIDIPYSIRDAQFRRALGYLLNPPFLEGNIVSGLYNGDQIFPAMLDAIKSAKKTITFESYIYWSGDTGEHFVEALADRAKAGVKVHVLIDWVGSQKISKDYIKRLRKAGVELEYYRPLRWYNIFRMNNRTHRKLLIIDGKLGFTGGVGISDDWMGNGDRPDVWRDSHYKLEGPVVHQLQTAFMDNWLKTRPEVHHGENYFPHISADKGSAVAQVFISSAQEGSMSVRLMYLIAIAAARESILLSSAYFLPDDLTIQELIQAKKRGVKIEVIVPGPYTDSHVVLKASKERWEKLLENGIELYQFQPARYHSKVLIIDDHFVSVGSTNFDERSFRLNDEANLNIIDDNFAKQERKVFEKDKALSKKVSLREWRKRPWTEKILENFAALFKNQF